MRASRPLHGARVIQPGPRSSAAFAPTLYRPRARPKQTPYLTSRMRSSQDVCSRLLLSLPHNQQPPSAQSHTWLSQVASRMLVWQSGAFAPPVVSPQFALLSFPKFSLLWTRRHTHTLLHRVAPLATQPETHSNRYSSSVAPLAPRLYPRRCFSSCSAPPACIA